MNALDTKYPYSQILPIAQRVLALLAPHCDRCEIAGSVRRQKPECKDIEVVAIPKPYDTGLFTSGIATVLNQWPIVKGQLPCLYTQRILPEGIKLDFFVANPENFGYIYMLRTGSREFNFKWVIDLKNLGYKPHDGAIYSNGHPVRVPEESDVFRLLKRDFVKPENRI